MVFPGPRKGNLGFLPLNSQRKEFKGIPGNSGGINNLAEFAVSSSTPESEVAAPIVPEVLPRFEFLQRKLHAFFSYRTTKNDISTMRWNLQANMPRANVDTEFDAFLVKLGLRDNRRYASQRWLMFKKSRGIYPPPKYQVDSNQMLQVWRTTSPIMKMPSFARLLT